MTGAQRALLGELRYHGETDPWCRAAADQIEWLLAVLKPFETAANDAEGYPDNHPVGCDPCMYLAELTVGDLRRAASACK